MMTKFNDVFTWHQRLAHLNQGDMTKLKKDLAIGVNFPEKE